MDNELKKIMIAFYALLSFLLSATYAAAIEHPHRQLRSYDSGISVSVQPKEITFYPGDKITVYCQAKGGVNVDEVPFVSFSRRLGRHTVMPLSFSSPGITIRPGIVNDLKDASHFTEAVKYITFSEIAYHMMDYGPNYFYCKGWNRRGVFSTDPFTVFKLRPTYDQRNMTSR